MKDIKICHISLGLYPDHRDGSAKFARGVYDELKRRGYQITMVTGKWSEGFNDPNIITVDVPNARYLWVPKFFLKVRKFLGRNKFDIIHCNGSRGALPVLFGNRKYIVNIHDLGPFEAQFTGIPILKWLEKRNAKKASKIITCSESIRHGVHQVMGADLEKIHNVYSAIDPKFKEDTTAAEKIKEKLGISGPVILYLGRIAFYKGVEYIIDAYYRVRKKMPDVNLVIGGKPTLKMKETVEKWKKKYPEVKFVGMVPDEEMVGYYTMADIFCTYSWASEGFGLTPIEALACKTPVVCSTMDAYKEVLQDYAYFVPMKNPEALAEKIEYVLKHYDEAKKLVDDAQDFIKRYTWKSVVDKIEDVYRDFLKNRQ